MLVAQYFSSSETLDKLRNAGREREEPSATESRPFEPAFHEQGRVPAKIEEMARPKHKRGAAVQGEALMHLCRVESKLRDLKKLATPDRFQNFVWELNDFISSAKKVINYLKSEPGRGSGFRRWLDQEVAGFSSTPRNKAFLDLRNISDKDCAIVPLQEHREVQIAADIEWTGPNLGELKDSQTGEIIVRIHSKDQSGVGENLTVTKTQVNYFFEGWPSEDILTFLANVAADLRNLVESAYSAFPNGFTLHKDSAVSTDALSAPK